MALNLMTPRYVAPDVTKAPLAAEAIRSSQASTNLAARAQQTRDRAQQAQEQQFGAELGLRSKEQAEASAARRGNLALGWERADQGWEELGLRAEAQSVNLANTEQRMRHAEEKLPFEMRGLNLANDAQDLKNELDDRTLEDQIAKIGLANAQTVAQTDALEASATATNQQTNFLKVHHDTDQAQKVQFASYQKQIEEAVKREDWEFVEKMVYSNVSPAHGTILLKMQDNVGRRKASLAAMATANRADITDVAQQTENIKTIDTKVPPKFRRYWRTPNQIGEVGTVPTEWVGANQVLTAEGEAALNAQVEWLGLGITPADEAILFPPQYQVYGGTKIGHKILGNTNDAGSTYLNGSMFVPTHEALQEAKALKAQQRAAFRATLEVQDAEALLHGMKVKLKSGKVVEREEAQAIVSEVRQAFDAIIESGVHDETPAGRSLAFKEALTGAKIAAGQIKVYKDEADYNNIKIGETYYDYHETDPTKMIKIWSTPDPNAPPSKASADPIQTGDTVKTGGRVNEARHELKAQLIDRGLTKELSDFVVKEAISGRSMLADDWDADDPTAGMLEQARRREAKRALEVRETIAENLFDFFWGEDENDISPSDIKMLEGYLDKPFWKWPKLQAREGVAARQPNAAEVATLKKEIPKYLEHHYRHNKLSEHLKSDQFKDESRDY